MDQISPHQCVSYNYCPVRTELAACSTLCKWITDEIHAYTGQGEIWLSPSGFRGVMDVVLEEHK